MKLTWTITEQCQGITLRDFLRKNQCISRKMLADIKYNGGKISVNGVEKTVRYALKSDDEVMVILPDEKISTNIVPVDIPLAIVYEDQHVIIVDKPVSFVTIPTRDKEEPSMAGAVLHYYQTTGWKATFHPVNRLDRDTSGLLIIAKHRLAHDMFVKQQTAIRRTYLAVLTGSVKWQFGSIVAPIARKKTSIIEREVSQSGKFAKTHYKCLRKTKETSLVKLTLETGRTHQIRVHMAWIGHPLEGDTLYGGSRHRMLRQALHASEVEFVHPFTNELLTFRARLPKDFEPIN